MSWRPPSGAGPPPQNLHSQPPGVENIQYVNYNRTAPPPIGNTQQYWAPQQPLYAGATHQPQYTGATQQPQFAGATSQSQYTGATSQAQYTGATPQSQYTGATPPFQYTGSAPATQSQYTGTAPATQNANHFYQHTQQAVQADGWENNWDWSWDERAKQNQQMQHQQHHQLQPPPPTDDNINANIEDSFGADESWNWAATQENHDNTQPPPPEIHSLEDREAVKEHRPDLIANKKVSLDKMTPQWSIESQMSQESSDGAPAVDDNLVDSRIQEDDVKTKVEKPEENLSEVMRDMSISNRDLPDNLETEEVPDIPNQQITPGPSLPPPVGAHSSLYPGQNPFKRAGPLSHKNVTSFPSNNQQGQSVNNREININRLSPNLSSNALAGSTIFPTQSSSHNGFLTANLESTPDNSERPDGPSEGSQYPQPAPLQVENLESASQHDRNQYLQTAHLSTTDYDYNEPGAPETEGPPPGLARMVPGQNTDSEGQTMSTTYRNRHGDGQTNDTRRQLGLGDGRRTPQERRPFGLDRMVPGESSNQFIQQFPTNNFNESEMRVVTGVDAADSQERESELADLQDLSAVSSVELSFRDQQADGATVETTAKTSDTTVLASARAPTSGDDTDRVLASPRRDKRRGSREQDRYRNRDDERRRSGDERRRRDDDRRNEDRRRDGDRRKEDDRRRDGDRRKDDDRRRDEEWKREDERRRGGRYDTEDTDYYSDRERERRKYRDRWSRPPRPEERSDERRYREDTRNYGSLRRRRGDDSRDPDPADEELDGRQERRPRRERDRDRPRRRHDQHRYGERMAEDQYQVQLQHQQQMYRYYEHLRLTNPAAYMVVYNKLMAGEPLPTPSRSTLRGFPGAGDLTAGLRDDRGSVHSGRSSATGLKDTDFNTDASLNLALEESTIRSDRATPFKYCTAHVKASLSSQHLVLVRPTYPVDGVPATVLVLEVANADPLLAQYPGPLVRDVTHKKTVMEYCEARVREVARGGGGGGDTPGAALLWRLLILLLRQNGVVVGSDIAELLLQSEREEPYPHLFRPGCRRGSSEVSESPAPTPPPPAPAADPAVALEQYRQFLLYGNRKEALEVAMSAGLWGHALQLAGSMERRVRAAVSGRFLASLPACDPLHTLYSSLGGRQPAACAAEERYGDWRPHLAMLLANPSSRPEQDLQAIVALGDSLSSRGLPYAAQFCYLMARVEFGRHPLAPLSPSPAPPTQPRLSLLLAAPRPTSLARFATVTSIAATEIYEYACSLSDPNFVLPELQVYKWLLTVRLADCGLYERALLYTEQIARAMLMNPTLYSAKLRYHVLTMADRLKYHDPGISSDPVLLGEDSPSDPSSPHRRPAAPADPGWLIDLLALHQHAESEQASVFTPAPPSSDPVAPAPPPEYAPAPPQPVPDLYYSAPQHSPQHAPLGYQTASQPSESGDTFAPGVSGTEDAETHPTFYQAPPQSSYQAPPLGDYWGQPSHYAEDGGSALEEDARPTITMPNSRGKGGRSLWDPDDDSPPRSASMGQGGGQAAGASAALASNAANNKEAAGGGAAGGGSGWLGGIFNKLSLKPKNQMILPDDKNPTIVWDDENKRWRDLSGGESEAAPPPPPPMSRPAQDTPSHNDSSGPPPAGSAPPPPAPGGNLYKMQRGRHIKKSYVDVLNPGGSSAPAPAPPGPPPPISAAPPSYFVPSPQE